MARLRTWDASKEKLPTEGMTGFGLVVRLRTRELDAMESLNGRERSCRLHCAWVVILLDWTRMMLVTLVFGTLSKRYR